MTGILFGVPNLAGFELFPWLAAAGGHCALFWLLIWRRLSFLPRLLQVAIVLFRTLEEFYNASFGWATLPLMLWRFATIGIGSLLTGGALFSSCCTGALTLT